MAPPSPPPPAQRRAERRPFRIPPTPGSIRRPPARSAGPQESRRFRQPLADNATASAPGMAASSPPSSPATCRGTTPPRQARSVRASASRPSTSSNRRASPFRPSSTWTRTTRSSPSRWRRRATPTRRRRLAGKRARKPCLEPPVPWLRRRCPRFGSVLVVLVVVAPPDALLVASLGCAIEPLIHAPKIVQPTGIGGVGMVDDAVLQHKGAHAWPFARVGGQVCPAHRGALRGPIGCLARGDGRLVVGDQLLQRLLAPIIVFDAPVALLLLAEPHVEVWIEVAGERRGPGEGPAHALLERLQLRELRPRHSPQHHVMVGQVSCDPVETVRDRRAGGTARLVVGSEHEVVDEQLRAPSEEILQRRAAVVGLEGVVLVDPDPRQLLPLPRHCIAAMRQLLLGLEKVKARREPVFPCSGHVCRHRSSLLRIVASSQARFSPCRSSGRRNTRPSGETTGRWDVHRYG